MYDDTGVSDLAPDPQAGDNCFRRPRVVEGTKLAGIVLSVDKAAIRMEDESHDSWR